jgi:hypothetical protein
MTPKEFSSFEKMLGSPSPFTAPLRVGVDYDRAIMNRGEAAVGASLLCSSYVKYVCVILLVCQIVEELFKNCQYVVTARSHNENPRFFEVCLLLKEHATKEDLLHGMMVAHWCRSLLVEESSPASPLSDGTTVSGDIPPSSTMTCPVTQSSLLHQQSLLCFLKSLRSGVANRWRSLRISVVDRRGLMNFRRDVIEKAISHTDHEGVCGSILPLYISVFLICHLNWYGRCVLFLAPVDGVPGSLSREFIAQLDESWASDMFLFESKYARIKK